MTDVVGVGAPPRRADAPSRPEMLRAVERTVDGLPVRGALPEGLEGRFLLIGPEPRRGPDGVDVPAGHGAAMVHEVRIGGGRADYRSRWISSDGPDAPSAGLVTHAGRLLALGAHGRPVVLDGSLVPMGDDAVGATGGSGAHARVDPVWDELLLVDAVPGEPRLVVTTIDVRGRVRRVAEVATDGPLLVHDFAITDRYVVLIATGAVEDGARVLWDPTVPARIGLVDRSAEVPEASWFEVAPRAVWHFVNAFERDGEVVIDHVAHRQPVVGVGGPGPLPGSTSPALVRTVVDPATGGIRDEVLDDRAVEHPAIDPARTGRRHRIVYAALADSRAVDPAGAFVGLVRHDLRDASSAEFRPADGARLGAPVFARRAGSTGEDDGWVLATAADPISGSSRLLVLGPRAFAAAPIAEIVLPAPVSAGLEAHWAPPAP